MNRRAVLALGGFGIGLVLHGPDRPALVWNASASAPVGVYRLVSGQAKRGDLALVRTPDSVRQLAAERGYIPANVPLIKRIVGQGGDMVCAFGDTIIENGQTIAKRLDHDHLGRPLPHWSGCHRLDSDEVFLLMAGVSDSFDGRYFGPVKTTLIIGRLVPLWTD